MASSQTNFTVTAGGVAENMLAARIGRSRLIITPLTEDVWIRFGGTAAVNAGELVYKDSPTTFSGEFFPEIGGALSVYAATTGSRITIREM